MEDWIAAEREADRRRKAEKDQREAELEAERGAAFAVGVAELQASWRERERVPAELETGEGVPWWRKLRLSRPALAAR